MCWLQTSAMFVVGDVGLGLDGREDLTPNQTVLFDFRETIFIKGQTTKLVLPRGTPQGQSYFIHVSKNMFLEVQNLQ